MDVEAKLKDYFKHLGFEADKIPESKGKSPDFFVHDSTLAFIVELKTKFPSESELAQRRQLLDDGLFHNVHENIVRNNTLSGIVKHAAEQLQYGDDNCLRLVFLLAVGHLAEPRFHQFLACLYGIAIIVNMDQSQARPCFFFGDSDFYRHRSILDAAIISTESKQSLALNPYSPRYGQILMSGLCERFGGGIIDPPVSEREGRAYIVFGNLDRRNESDVLAYVKAKYKSPNLTKVDMNFLSRTVQWSADLNGL